MAMKVAQVEDVNHRKALSSPAQPDPAAAGTRTDQVYVTGSLDPLIIALAHAVDRVGPAQPPGRRPETAS